jgi:hypothetical protein
MAAKKIDDSESSTELLKNLMIIQLGLAGVAQHSIRTIVGCDMNRVNRIVKHLKPKTGDGAK